MQKIYFLLLVILFTPFYVKAAAKTEKDDPKTNPPSNVLPLMLLKQANGDLTIPKSMDIKETNSIGIPVTSTIFYALNVVFFCGPDKNNGGNKLVKAHKSSKTDNIHCSFSMSFHSSTLSNCPKEPEPYVQKITIHNPSTGKVGNVVCGPEGKDGIMFAFQYKACTTKSTIWGLGPRKITNRVNLEMYRFCYSQKENQVIYTEHTIKSPSTLRDSRLQNDQKQTYEMMTEGYQYFGSSFVAAQEVYLQLEKENKLDEILMKRIKKPSTRRKSHLREKKLVPHEDLAFALWRKPTYHYLNIKLMREQQIDLWEHINELIRDDAIKYNKEYQIYTGAFKVFHQESEDQTIYPIMLADIWVKIVQYKLETPVATPNGHKIRKSFAIVMNNDLDKKSMTALFNQICPEHLCEGVFSQQFAKLGDSVRCCHTTRSILKFFNLQFGSDEPFIIDSLSITK